MHWRAGELSYGLTRLARGRRGLAKVAPRRISARQWGFFVASTPRPQDEEAARPPHRHSLPCLRSTRRCGRGGRADSACCMRSIPSSRRMPSSAGLSWTFMPRLALAAWTAFASSSRVILEACTPGAATARHRSGSRNRIGDGSSQGSAAPSRQQGLNRVSRREPNSGPGQYHNLQATG